MGACRWWVRRGGGWSELDAGRRVLQTAQALGATASCTPIPPARLTALHEPSVDMIEVWDEEPSVDMVEVWDEEPCRVPGSRSPTPPRGGDVGQQRLLLGA